MYTIRDDSVRGKMMQVASVIFFAGLLFSLNGTIFDQKADATVCFSTEMVFERPKEKVAIVTVTVISSETETYDPPIYGLEYDILNRVTTTFTIDETIYGNDGFPLESDSISEINSRAVKIGDRYVVGYYLFDGEWWILDDCSTLEHISFVEFVAFYEDMLTNPCGVDTRYLVKNSDLEKFCARHDTGDKLIERGAGFFVPNLSFHEWKQISGDPPLDVSSDVYETAHHAVAEVPSPLQQVLDGTPADKVVCNDDRVLMQTPSNRPVCVFVTTVETLEQRGFISISAVTVSAVTVSAVTINNSNSSTESAGIPEFLTKIPEDKKHSEPISSLTPFTVYVTRSELVITDVSALNSSQINIALFDETLTLSKDRIEASDLVDYAWYGTGDGAYAILLVNGTSVYGLIDVHGGAKYSIEFTEIEHVHWLYEKIIPEYPD